MHDTGQARASRHSASIGHIPLCIFGSRPWGHLPPLDIVITIFTRSCWSLANPQRSAAGGGGEGGGPRLWVVTRGAVVTGKTDRLGSLSASLWAMARSAMFEAPGLWAALVDVQVRGSSGVRAILLLPVQVMR